MNQAFERLSVLQRECTNVSDKYQRTGIDCKISLAMLPVTLFERRLKRLVWEQKGYKCEGCSGPQLRIIVQPRTEPRFLLRFPHSPAESYH